MMTDSARICGIILAGGQSRRMGQDKAKLQLGGISLLDHARQLLLDAGVDKIMVSGGDDAGALADVWDARGPLGGIASVVLNAQNRACDGYVIVPVDMPLLTSQDISLLVECGLKHNCLVHFTQSNLPLFTPDNDRLQNYLLDTMHNATTGRALSIRRFCLSLDATTINFQNDKRLLNVNEQAHWLAIKAMIKENA